MGDETAVSFLTNSLGLTVDADSLPIAMAGPVEAIGLATLYEAYDAGAAGSLDRVSDLVRTCRGSARDAVCFLTALVAAAEGRSHVLAWLRVEAPGPWGDKLCAAAVSHGGSAALGLLRAQDPPYPWAGAMSSAAALGNDEVLEWLLERRDPPCPPDCATLAYLAKRGDLGRIQTLRARAPLCPWDMSAYVAAVAGGHLGILRWLAAQDPPCSWDVTNDPEMEWISGLSAADLCSSVIGCGRFDILLWLRSQDPPAPWGRESCAGAIYGGHDQKALAWLRARRPPCPWGEGVYTAATEMDRLDIVQWLRAQNPPCPWDADMCAAAAEMGFLDILVFLYTAGAPYCAPEHVHANCRKFLEANAARWAARG